MSLRRAGFERILWPVSCFAALAALAAFVSLNRDAQATLEAFAQLKRLAGKYNLGFREVATAGLRLMLTLAYPAIVLTAAWRAGGALVGWLRCGAGGGERVVLAVALGLGLVSLALAGIAVTGLLAAPTPLALACLIIAVGGGRSARRGRRPPASSWTTAAAGPALLALLALLWDLPGAFGPEWFEDGRTYHLGLPDRFLLTAKMPVMPGHLLGFLPLNTEMGYLAVMGLISDAVVREEAARLFNWALGALAMAATGVLAARLCRAQDRGADPRLAWATAAWLFVSMPVTMVENEICFTDNWRVLLETAALILVLRGGAASRVAAAGCAGFAMGGKYLAVFRGALLAGAVLARAPRRQGLRRAAGFTAVAALLLGPWLVRGWLAGGDPVYPFLPGVFRPVGFDAALLDRWMDDNRHYGVAGMTWSSWSSLPVRCALRPGDSDFGTFTTGPMLLGFAPLLLGGGWSAAAVVCATVAAGEMLAWSVTSHLIRYLLPALAVVCALLGSRIAVVAARAPGYGRVLLGLAALWAVPAGVMRVHHRVNLDDMFHTLGSALGRGDAESVAAGRGFGAAADGLGAGAVLLVGEDRVLGLGRRWIAASRYDLSLIKRWAAESRDTRRFALKVRQAGVGAVILHGDQFRAWQGRGPAFELTPAELARVNPWWRGLRVVWRRPPWEGSVPGPR